MSGQAPFAYTPQVNYTTFAQIAASGRAIWCSDLRTTNMWPADKNVPWDRVQNASLNIQRSIGAGTVLDVGYTGNWGYNQNLTYDINPIPIGTRAPFNPKNADATNGNKTLPDIFLRTVFPGFNTINAYHLLGHTNYHALTVSVQRRFSHGLAVGAWPTRLQGHGHDRLTIRWCRTTKRGTTDAWASTGGITCRSTTPTNIPNLGKSAALEAAGRLCGPLDSLGHLLHAERRAVQSRRAAT